MRDASRDKRVSLFGRRNFLKVAGVATASVAMAGTASASHDDYDEVVNIVEEGADDSGEESINPVLDDLEEDSILIEFPDGEYKVDRQFRHTGFDEFGLVAPDGDATIVPVPADDWEGNARRILKLGTYETPGDRLHVEGLTFDFTAPDTGLRALQAQVDDPLVRDVAVEGTHDTGNWGPGPFLVDVTDPDGTGRVERVDLTGGGVMEESSDSVSLGPIGFNVSPYHEGTLEVVDTRLFGFPSNGFYSSSEDGRIVISGGLYKNNNVANVRISGASSEIRRANVVVTDSPEGWDAQNGIRLDGGEHRIDGAVVWSPRPTGNGIRVTGDADSARIDDSVVAYGPGHGDAVVVAAGSGPVTFADSDIWKHGPGQALQIQSSGAPVSVSNVWIRGKAPGGDGGSHTIRCERDNCAFRWVHVDQPGEDYRRCLAIVADDCTVVGGEYTSTHHPIVIDADGFDVRGVETQAYNDSEGVKVYGGNDGGRIVNSTIYNGIDDRGSDFETRGNEYPES